ncbi:MULTISPECIES: DUF421 domain-containing protein [Virgibacillus]|uniref:YetF C-terminal domain-containing protein n=2 Tax=Virgibacillus TaxID=84406 RepID=A0A024QDA8_9BACI|nr:MULTISPECIES: YetF domain-containing protein [Virgibacillus]EQB36231.1 hypothetical protein M948_14445 [Virgibacillus sp. CM-4]GGJ45542.1 DUF421 domain-containing protein [Virgibacillus kapii]CDQ39931.1 hypothetical protein BN990_02248 [Virgibacillus massiliensis]
MEEIIATLFRTPLMFLIILLFFRLTGKKDVGEVSVLEIAITLMVTDLAVIIIEDTELSILNGLVPIVILIIIQYILSYVTLKNQKTRDIMDGRPSLIIENGRCNQVEMKKIGYTLDDLYTELRNNNIADISKVQFAVLESSGDLNVFDDQTKFSLPLILDGVVQTEQVKIMGVNEMWLIQQLEQKGYTDLSSIFICSYTGGNLYIEEKQK